MDRSQKIEAVFKRLDKDRSGDIDKSEIKRFFKKAAGENHAQRNETADKLLDYFDTDGDGCIDYDEFKQGIKNLERGEGAAFLKSKLEFFFENERVDPKDGQLKTFALFLKHSTDKQDAQVSIICPIAARVLRFHSARVRTTRETMLTKSPGCCGGRIDGTRPNGCKMKRKESKKK